MMQPPARLSSSSYCQLWAEIVPRCAQLPVINNDIHQPGQLANRTYGSVTLFAGDVLFDEVGMLQASEFDREAVFNVTDYPARRLADRNNGTHDRP